MKSTGVVRRIDELGRIVLPSEIRRALGIQEGDELEIGVQGEQVTLQKRQDVCLFCSKENPEFRFRGRRLCADCARGIAGLAETEIELPEDPEA